VAALGITGTAPHHLSGSPDVAAPVPNGQNLWFLDVPGNLSILSGS